jgi:ABC-type metal ion transport system substrate-binding protein
MGATTAGLNTYAVTIRSKFTAMLVTFGGMRAADTKEAKTIAVGCMANPHAWVADNAVKQG